MIWIAIISVVVGMVAILQSISMAGIEAPMPTPLSNALGYGGAASIILGILIFLYWLVRLIARI